MQLRHELLLHEPGRLKTLPHPLRDGQTLLLLCLRNRPLSTHALVAKIRLRPRDDRWPAAPHGRRPRPIRLIAAMHPRWSPKKIGLVSSAARQRCRPFTSPAHAPYPHGPRDAHSPISPRLPAPHGRTPDSSVLVRGAIALLRAQCPRLERCGGPQSGADVDDRCTARARCMHIHMPAAHLRVRADASVRHIHAYMHT